MKKCKRFLKLLSLSIDGKLTKKEEEILKKHLIECENCKKAKEDLEKISKELKNISIILPDKARFKIKKFEIQKPYKFQFSTIFPFLFALVFFILVFFLWQNLKEKSFPFCLEVKEEISDNFPKMIKRIYLKKEVPEDFFLLFQLDLREGKKEIKKVETNYPSMENYFLKEFEKWEWENFEKKVYYLKIYPCP